MVKKRFLTDEEQALWELVNQTTKRLTTKKKVVVQAKPLPEKPLKKKSLEVELLPCFNNPSPFTPSSEIDTLDRRTSRKIRKQSLSIDGRLDLHGFIQKDAYARLQTFIKSAHTKGYKLVLIITGKGYSGSAETKGVLRQKLPQWLKDPRTFPEVLSLSSAQPQDGGNGAYYVFLKKQK
jgi:DNA-nicking Smr family endonuclease